MHKWNLIIDVARCENCHNCTLAVKDEHVDNDFPGYAAPIPRHGKGLIEIERKVRGTGHHVDVAYLPKMCNHCDDAPCLKASGADGAVRKRADGIVIVDPVKAKGRRDLVAACPYGAIVWNEEADVPQNWTFDAHLLDQGWKQPRCAHSCPTDVFTVVDAEPAQMQARATAERLDVLKPELGTGPRVYYKNLSRIASHFVGGSVITTVSKRNECVEDAEVSLSLDGREIARTRTDAFGDFKIDGLTPTTGDYTVRIIREGFPKATATAKADAATYLGELRLGG